MDYFSNIDWKTTALYMPSIVALIAVIAGPFFTYKIMKRQISSTISSNERKEWIAELRNTVSKYIATSNLFTQKLLFYEKENLRKELIDECQKLHQDMMFLQPQILLLLDPSKTEQMDIIKAINEESSVVTKYFVESKKVEQAVFSTLSADIHLKTSIVIQNELKSLKN